jgi:rhomboid protease GluP
MNFPPRSNVDGVQQPPPPGVPVTVKLPAKKPMVTYVLIGVTVLVYLLQSLSTSLSPGGVDWPFVLGGKINELILQGQVWRLLTPALLHGSLLHIAFLTGKFAGALLRSR